MGLLSQSKIFSKQKICDARKFCLALLPSFFFFLMMLFGLTNTVLADPDLSLTKSHSGNFTLDVIGTYTLTVTNHQSASSTIDTITLTDTLPTGLTYVSATGVGWTCGATNQVVTCSNPGPLAPSASSSITLTVNPTIAGNLTNIANVATTNDTDPSNDTASDPTLVNATPQPDLSITKTHSGSFTLGTNGIYTLSITNVGAAGTTGTITVTDTLPIGMTFVSATGAGWTCSAINQIVTCTNAGALAPSASSAISLTVGVNLAGTLTNRATVSVTGDNNASNNTASDPTLVNATPQPDLSITKTHSGSFTLGTNGAYTLTVTNVGAASTTGTITVTDTLPIGMTFVSATGVGWTCNPNNQIISCTNSGILAPSASSSLTLTVNLSVADGLTNIATVSTPGDQNTANNIARDPTTITADNQPDLSIAKTHSGSFTVGTNGSYLISVTNVGTANATGTITVTDTLPAGLSYVSGVGSGWTCTAANQVITCTVAGPITPASNRTITISVLPTLGGTLTNIANVSGAGDNNAANNTASDPTLVNPATQPDLSLSKSHSGNFTNGSTGAYTLTVTNLGNAGTTGAITVTDTLPSGITYVSASGTGWTCTNSNQTVTCNNPGPLAPSATSEINLSVSVNASGHLTNVATVSTAGDANSTNDTATDPTTVNASLQPDLSITKTHVGNFTVGIPASYTITITNIGSASTTGPTTVTDTVPLGLSFVAGTSTGWTCSALNQTVTCINPNLLASTSSSTIAINVNAQTAGNWTNVATVDTNGDNNFANNTASDPTVVNASPQPDLEITKTHTGNFIVGTNASYILTITNIGAAATSSALTVIDTLPVGLNFISGIGTGWTCGASGQVVTCTNSDSLARSATTTITISVDVDLSGGLTNIATVSTAGDTNHANNFTTDPTIVMPAGAVLLNAKMRVDLLTPFLTYTVIITNTGMHPQQDNAGHEFVSPIPLGTLFVPAQSHATTGLLTYDSANKKVHWDGAIASSESVTITFTVDATTLLAGNNETQVNTADTASLFITSWLLSLIFGAIAFFRRRRKLFIFVLLLLAMGLASTGCTVFTLRHAIICNQGQIYYDSDSNGTNDSVILTDDPRMPVDGAPTCL